MKYAKAIVGALIAGLGALGTALAVGPVTTSGWVAIAVTTLVALGAVFGVPNQTDVVDAGELAGMVTRAADDAKAVLDAITNAARPTPTVGPPPMFPVTVSDTVPPASS